MRPSALLHPFHALFLLTLSLGVARADVLIVDAGGGGDHTSLTAAVAAAADGDLLLVQPGEYLEPGPVVIEGKSLSIVGDVHGLPQAEVMGGILIMDLSAHQRVVLKNLVINGSPSTAIAPAGRGLRLVNTAGQVRVQECRIVGGPGATNTFPNGMGAMLVSGANALVIVNSSIWGGNGQFSPTLSFQTGDGGPGLQQAGSQIEIQGTGVYGGKGGGNQIGGWPDGGDGGAAIDSFGGTLYLTGSVLIGGNGGISHFGGDGGPGLVLQGGATAIARAGFSVSGGAGGPSDVGPDGKGGASIIDPLGGFTNLGGQKRSFRVDSPLRPGEIGVLDFGGLVSDQLLLLLGFSHGFLPLAGSLGVALVDPFTLQILVIPGPGNLDLPITAPSLPPGLAALDLWLQPAFLHGGGASLGWGYLLTILGGGL